MAADEKRADQAYRYKLTFHRRAYFIVAVPAGGALQIRHKAHG